MSLRGFLPKQSLISQEKQIASQKARNDKRFVEFSSNNNQPQIRFEVQYIV